MTQLGSLVEREIRAFRSDWIGRDQAKATLRTYERHLRKYFSEYTTLELFTAREHVLSFHSKHEARFAARALKAYSKWLSQEYDEHDVIAKLRLPKEPLSTETRIATPADVSAMLAVCRATGRNRWLALRDHAIISVLASTGMRRSELARMQMRDVDFEVGTIEIPITKNNDPRVVQLTDDALRSLRRYLRHSETSTAHVWRTQHGTALSSEAVRRVVQRRASTAGVDVTCHSFRRGLALEWLRRGGSETLLRQQAGWKSPAMVGRYVRAQAQAASLAEHRRLFSSQQH